MMTRRLPAPPSWDGPLPPASPPAEMALFQLPTGTYENRAAFALRGGSFRDRRRFAATAVLVRHPAGDLLIDAGFGERVDKHLLKLPWFQRSPHTAGRTARRQLDDSGYDLGRLRGVVITHAHWDHVSGLDGLPVPVWMNAAERDYVERTAAGGAAVFRDVVAGRVIHDYTFVGPAHLGFPGSHDVHGDGSVVIVPAGGHTDGSVVVFVTLPGGARYAFIGDLTWQCDGVIERVERPLLMQRLADVDPVQVRHGLLRVIALAGRMQVVPAHDLRAYDGIPTLPPA